MLQSDAHTHLLPPLNGTGCRCVCGTSPQDWEQVALMAEQDPRVIPFFGIHPWFLNPDTWEQDIKLLESFISRYPSAGIGETGLDKCRRGIPGLPLQQEILSKHLQLAEQYARPVTLHCCRAWGTLAKTMCNHPHTRAIFHGWTGAIHPLLDLPSLNWLLSLGPGTCQDTQLLRAIPLEQLVLESDDQPATLPDTYRTAAHALQLPLDTLVSITTNNLARVIHPAP